MDCCLIEISAGDRGNRIWQYRQYFMEGKKHISRGNQFRNNGWVMKVFWQIA